MISFTVVWYLHSELEGHTEVECWTVAEAVEIAEQLLERDDDFVRNGHLGNLVIDGVIDNSICRCRGCNYARSTGFDAECDRTLEAEAEEREAENRAELLDQIEARGANRFGNDWFYDQPYVWKVTGDEIPF